MIMISKVVKRMPARLKKIDTWIFILKRIIYIVGFTCLCIIDQMTGSVTGYIQHGIKNYTGIIIGIFILTAFNIKDFIKFPYLIWIVSFFTARNFLGDWLKEIIYNDMELETSLWGISLYGIILIRLFYLCAIEKKKFRMNWIPFMFWLIMLIGMVIIRSDYSWPKALLGAFLCFYLTDFKEKDLNNLFFGMVEGIIIGFLIVQIQAWMYRPYDTLRYKGMYSHANMNALMYLCAYCATLCKWYLMKLKKRNILLRVPFIALAGLIVGTMLYTGGRTAFITAVVLTMVFLLFQVLSRRKWVWKSVEFLADGIILGISIGLCVLPAYWMIRYMPVYFNEPLYFETDYAEGVEKKIQKDEQVDSEKYVEFDEATDEMFNRYLWFLDDETFEKVVDWIREFPESLKLSLKVDAATYLDTDLWNVEDNDTKQFIHPILGKVTETEKNYRVSSLIDIGGMSGVTLSSDKGFTSSIGWRFFDEKGDVVSYGRYAQGETKQIFVIPADAKYFQFTWNVDNNSDLRVMLTDTNIEEANVKVVEAGSDSEHPLVLSEEQDGAYDVREDIYRYFFRKLTWIGEKNNVQGVWIYRAYQATHCHNVFLQIAYDFGIIIGVMFIMAVLIFYICVIIGLIRKRSGSWYYRLFVATIYVTLFVVFGMFELDWVYGQLPFTMFFLLQYIVYHKEPEKRSVLPEPDESLTVATEFAPNSTTVSELPELEIVEL